VNDMQIFEKLAQAKLSSTQQNQLFNLILAVFEQAIDVRSPKRRPPGKAGLRSEKGYYRLLYLEGDFQEKVRDRDDDPAQTPAYDWGVIAVLLKQLKDIPELQSEIMEGIEAALLEITTPG